MAMTQNWNVEIEGQQYEISYKPSIWSGKIKLMINGEETILKSNGLQGLVGIDAPFDIGGKQLQFVRTGQKADIAMDGVFIDSNKEYQPIGKVPWWGWIFVVLGLAIPVAALGGALPFLIGFGDAIICARISVKRGMNTVVKVLICLGVTILAWILLGVLLIGVSLI